VSSAEETAYDVYRTLVAHGLERHEPGPPRYEFEATADTAAFQRLASRFLGPELISVETFETGSIQLPREIR
jgi:glutamate racemase